MSAKNTPQCASPAIIIVKECCNDREGHAKSNEDKCESSQNFPLMNSGMFRESGHQIVDWAATYMSTLKLRNPTSDVSHKWLRNAIPSEPPAKREPFKKLFDDIEEVICKGMTHWQHPQFFAYFPAGNSWASIMGDILSNATGANGQTWVSCPVITELETRVMDWVCKFLGLPKFFLSSYSLEGSQGYGIMQASASEAIFCSMIYARQDAIMKLREKHKDLPKAQLLNKLVAYCGSECHCCVERGAMAGCIRLKKLKTDEVGVVRAHVLKAAILEDIEKGLVPFFHCAIIGSTRNTCSDDLMEIGPLCEKFGLWLHVDAAYAGCSFILPEMEHIKQGFQYAWSTNINTNKWMMCNFEASLHWVRYREKAVNCFAVDPRRITEYPNNVGPDLRHYGISHSRRFRAVKLYFVIRNYGVSGLQRYIRNHINLAKLFEMYVQRDSRFEVVGGPFKFGLVAFRLKGYNELTTDLMDALNSSHRIHVVASHFHDKIAIRFALCHEHACERDVDKAWRTIDEYASVIIRKLKEKDDTIIKHIVWHQELHDEMRKMFPDRDIDKEEEQATIVYDKLLKDRGEVGFVERARSNIRDGSWDRAVDEEFKKHDINLRENPGRYINPNKDTSHAVLNTTMLHVDTLLTTYANSPSAKVKESVPVMSCGNVAETMNQKKSLSVISKEGDGNKLQNKK